MLFSGVIIVIIVIIIILGLFAIGQYNKLRRLAVNVDTSWSNIEVQLNRRYSLIPNLVTAVKSYTNYESSTLENLGQIVKDATSASGSASREKLEGELSKLIALGQSYPELKANTQYAQLTGSLSDTENQIAQVRETYNNSVKMLNTALATFPTSLFSGLANVKPAAFFDSNASEKAAVEATPRIDL
jgi:LemA protein